MIRKGNEDSGYAGPHLLLVADGMGGHAFGEVASSAALAILVELEPVPGAEHDLTKDPVAQVRDQVALAGQSLRSMITQRPELEGMGTTVTALLQVDDRVVIAQVGDSRGYLLRDGVLEQVTRDQTFVQSLIDEGRISQDAARTHPQRSLLLQALDGRVEVSPDISVRTPMIGDRYLLCSDGLSGVLSETTMREVLMVGTPDEAVDQLIDLALRGGAPDNVTCVVADVAEGGDDLPAPGEQVAEPRMVGAAAESALLASHGLPPGQASVALGEQDEPGGSHPGIGFRLLLPVLLLVVVAAAAAFGYRWTQQQYYVGVSNGQVAIYRGVPQHLAGHRLSRVVESSEMAVKDLPTYAQDRVNDTISAGDLAQARVILDNLRVAATTCKTYPEPVGCAPGLAASPTPTPTAGPRGTASASPSASKS